MSTKSSIKELAPGLHRCEKCGRVIDVTSWPKFKANPSRGTLSHLLAMGQAQVKIHLRVCQLKRSKFTREENDQKNAALLESHSRVIASLEKVLRHAS